MKDSEILKEARDLLVMCSLLDKSGKCMELVNKIDDHVKSPNIEPRKFYVVAKTYETGDDLAQLSTALDSYDRAKNFRDSDFNKQRYPNAFIVSDLNEIKD